MGSHHQIYIHGRGSAHVAQVQLCFSHRLYLAFLNKQHGKLGSRVLTLAVPRELLCLKVKIQLVSRHRGISDVAYVMQIKHGPMLLHTKLSFCMYKEP